MASYAIINRSTSGFTFEIMEATFLSPPRILSVHEDITKLFDSTQSSQYIIDYSKIQDNKYTFLKKIFY